jgi:hypothetical protein
MSISYKELPDYNQFIQSYFVDQQLLDSEEAGTAEFEPVEQETSSGDSSNDDEFEIPPGAYGGYVI